MANFIFQSRRERTDLREEIIPGMQVTWYATRYQKDMHIGDIVFFWLAGPPEIRGIYGWGRITSSPYIDKKAGWTSHGVDVKYEVRFDKPILAGVIRANPHLSEMLIFRVASATNFLLSDDQASYLKQLITEQGEIAPP